MDINGLLQGAAQLFQSQLDTDRDGQLESAEIVSALMSLLSNNQGQFNLNSFLSGMQSGGNNDLMSLAASWLGKGENLPVTGGQLEQILGHEKIAEFAKQLGISETSALNGLRQAVPDVVDKASPDGTLMEFGEQLLERAGGISGLINAAASLLGDKKTV